MLYNKFSKTIKTEVVSDYKTYKTDKGKETLHIPSRYTVIKQVGSGATSVVVKAFQKSNTSDVVAIKKVKRVFEHTAFAHRAMRELRILRCLGDHDNIIKVNEIIMPSDPVNFNELYIVTDYM